MNQINMTVEKYFPTPMGYGYNVELAQKYLPLVQDMLSNPKSYNPSFFPNGRTTHHTEFEIAKMPEFKEMRDLIYELGCEFMHQCGYRRDSIKNEVFMIANALNYGGFHKSHTHFDCVLSGVIYLTAPEGSSFVEFEDPIDARKIHKYPVEDPNNPLTWDFVYTQPQVGLYNIWPLWFRHMVLQNESTEPRIAVAFNIG
jgi:uncharacterized protein (TIGR02466 family)